MTKHGLHSSWTFRLRPSFKWLITVIIIQLRKLIEYFLHTYGSHEQFDKKKQIFIRQCWLKIICRNSRPPSQRQCQYSISLRWLSPAWSLRAQFAVLPFFQFTFITHIWSLVVFSQSATATVGRWRHLAVALSPSYNILYVNFLNWELRHAYRNDTFIKSVNTKFAQNFNSVSMSSSFNRGCFDMKILESNYFFIWWCGNFNKFLHKKSDVV